MNWTKTTASLPLICAALLLASTLQGCRKDEQGRILYYDKGTYLGHPDEKLTPAQVEALRQRVANERD